jgi:error-prone DNA polymerase
VSSAEAPAYAELHCVSNFSFLRGASHPEELVRRAHALGYHALALTDEASVSGVVRAHVAAKELGLKLIVGSELRCADGLHIVVLATTRAGYGNLCSVITGARRAAVKGDYVIERQALSGALDECLVLWFPSGDQDEDDGRWLLHAFPNRAWLAVELLAEGDDRRRLAARCELAVRIGLPAVASGDVHMHERGRRALQDTVTAIRLRTTVNKAALALHASGERHLRKRASLARLYPPALLQESVRVAARCRFSLDELRYEYPREIIPDGYTPQGYLRKVTEEGMARRWPGGAGERVRAMIERELALIAELGYEAYFLTVYDIVRFARSRDILCQGRGSAANSAVCFCLHITEVDPARMAMLFERFISKERNEPPDIDVDFEHERREEVIQYIYAKYGRDRAALAATLITYRPRSAMRDVGKALGLDTLQVDRLARAMQWWDGRRIDDERIRESGFAPDNPMIHRLVTLVRELQGFPRHLSQHVGGFVIARDTLHRLVPVENAAMQDRTVIQWDKNDLEDLGLLKVDVLGLGMLTAIRRSFDLIERYRGVRHTIASVPAEDPRVYDMIGQGDTLGVFQIESRAQMAMLPRMRPRRFYDLVIEVAIVRPGPIQGDMVHPYLRRRNGEEAVSYPSEAVRDVLARTLGVPIFQEQVMHLAMVAAGFTAGQADQLRRAMAAWKRRGGLGPFESLLLEGMRERGYSDDFAQRIFSQIKGFGEYGFPESHAASFALLVYVSAWLKCFEPAAFFAALLNSQPMGFYAPAQLVTGARRAGVEVRPVDVVHSYWDCTLERGAGGEPALRLGLRQVRGLHENAAERLLRVRAARSGRVSAPFDSVTDMAHAAHLSRGDLEALAGGDALAGLSGHRHRARWEVTGVERATPLLGGVEILEAAPLLKKPDGGQDVIADYRYLGLSLKNHPLALLRERLTTDGACSAADIRALPDGAWIRTAGLVITRQRPGTASGVTFVTLEDETGHSNLVVWRKIAEKQRKALLRSRLMGARGQVQRQGNVIHVVVRQMTDLSHWLDGLVPQSRDFH